MLGQSGEAEHQGRRPAACNPQRRDPLDGHATLGSRVSEPQPTAGDPRGDTSAAQGPLAGRVVVTLVAMQFGRSPARPTRPTAWPDSSIMLAPLPCDASVCPAALSAPRALGRARPGHTAAAASTAGGDPARRELPVSVSHRAVKRSPAAVRRGALPGETASNLRRCWSENQSSSQRPQLR